MDSTPVGDSENSFSEYFSVRVFLHYLHFIQVTSPFTKPCCTAFVSLSVCNCASLVCDACSNPARDYLPSLNLPVLMYIVHVCYMTKLVQRANNIYHTIRLLHCHIQMFFIVYVLGSVRLCKPETEGQSIQKENLMEKLQN